MLTKAITLAAEAHKGQKDKGGEPYILHPLRVMCSLDNDIDRIVALLHDAVEDTALTISMLALEEIPAEAIEAISCLTKQDTETYDAYIDRILTNPVAMRVKLADLKDNMNLARLKEVPPDDLLRQEKYAKTKEKIENAFAEI